MATLAFNFSYAAEPKRIALLPFTINADKDLSFLKGGIFEMLTSRLSKSGQVEVLSKAPVAAAIYSIVKSKAINETTAENRIANGNCTVTQNRTFGRTRKCR